MRKIVLAFVFSLIILGTGLGSTQAQQSPQTQKYTGQLDGSTLDQDYQVELKQGDDVMITASATEKSNLDPTLKLFDPSGKQVAENDDADVSTQDAQIPYVVPADGDYRVNISRYDTTTSGTYELDVVVGDANVLDYDVKLSGQEEAVDTQHFRFHYTESGVDAVTPDFLQATEKAFEDAWHIEIDKLGWPRPPSDGFMGGNGLYDVYLQDLIGSGDGAELGYTSPELLVGDNPNTPQTEKSATTSYIVIDNDFHNLDLTGGHTAVSEMRTTAVHEFNHALQMGLDGLEPATWLAESTAVWMETVAAGKDQDGTGYVAQAYQYPELCLGTTAQDNGIMYGEWPFMQLLTDDFGKDAVLNLWYQIVNYDGFDAVQHYLNTVGSTLPREAARYRINNLARNYTLAPQFKATVWLEDTISGLGEWSHGADDSGVQGLGASYFAFKLTPGNYDVEVRDSGNKLDLWALGVTSQNIQAIDLGRGGGIDTRNYQQTYLMVFNPTFTENLDKCTSIDYKIEVMKGKGTTNPVDSLWSRKYFEPLTQGD